MPVNKVPAFWNLDLIEQKKGITNYTPSPGRQYDRETGRYYLRARYYNPALGRHIPCSTERPRAITDDGSAHRFFLPGQSFGNDSAQTGSTGSPAH